MSSKFKFKVPCDSFIDEIDFDGKSSGDDVDEIIGVAVGGDDYFPRRALLIDKTLSFEFLLTDLVGLWGYTKTKDAAKSLVDYIAHREGEVPSDLYDRIIYKVAAK